MSEIATITDNDIGNCLKDFEILQVLGKGAFGFVAKVKSKKNLKIYAMKKNDLSIIDDDDIKKYYENEGIFMKVLDHPNICKLYTTFKENNSVYLIMEYMDSGDLFTFLDAYKKLGEYISEEKLCIIFLQCLNSLQYIHSLGIIHRDIKNLQIFYIIVMEKLNYLILMYLLYKILKMQCFSQKMKKKKKNLLIEVHK